MKDLVTSFYTEAVKMDKSYSNHQNSVYQFKITLRDINPPIWRRIQVPPTYNFWDLHMAIQSALGWTDSHPHQFTILFPTSKRVRAKLIVIPKLRAKDEEELDKDYILSSKDALLSDYFLSPKTCPKVVYEYDFLSGWECTVLFEEFVSVDSTKKCPRCVDGGLASPPEQVGGIESYKKFVKYYVKYAKLDKPTREYCKCVKECVHSIAPRMFELGFDPVVFDPKLVEFYDPELFWQFFVKKIITVQRNWMFASY